jgi:3-hydroxyisobutyrate dehydrogenase-like beta-hydroxyacid dehydrogenase
MTRVGFIGLGNQGAPIARRILDAGYPTTIWARRPASLAPFTATPATTAATPAELGAVSDLVGVCVVDDAGVEQVLTGPNGVLAGMAPGGVVAVHSTTHPDTCRRLAQHAATRGVTVLDAPVSGGGIAAAERRLLVMVGGEAGAAERCRPVFETFGNPVIHLGPVGSGQLAKLLNNLLFTGHLALGTQAFTLAAALGVEPGQLARVLAHGSGGSTAIATIARSNYTAATMADVAGPLLLKDLKILVELAQAADAPVGKLVEIADEALNAMGRHR